VDLGANESRCGQGLYWKKRRRGEEKREEMEEEEERPSLYISFASAIEGEREGEGGTK